MIKLSTAIAVVAVGFILFSHHELASTTRKAMSDTLTSTATVLKAGPVAVVSADSGKTIVAETPVNAPAKTKAVKNAIVAPPVANDVAATAKTN